MRHTLYGPGAALVAALALSSPAPAQAPGAFPPMVPSAHGAAMPPPMPPGAGMKPFSPGQGGFGRRTVFGVVKAVDTTANTLTIMPTTGGGVQTIKVGASTQIVRQASVAAADLKANDQVQVSGIPTQITASQVVAGQLPTGFPGRRSASRAGFRSGETGDDGIGPTGEATATVDARVLQASPLLLSLGNGVTISVKMAVGARISRIASVALGAVKIGDQVFALGQADDAGTITATSVGVNLDTGGNGLGGYSDPGPAMMAPTQPPVPMPSDGPVGAQIVPGE